MGAVSDIIELAVGFIAIPAAVLFAWQFIVGYIGFDLPYLIIPLIIYGAIAYFLFNVRVMIAYGLILYIISIIFGFILSLTGFSL